MPNKSGKTKAKPSAPPARKKIRATFVLPPELFEEVRDTVVALSGPPHRMTMAALAEKALRGELERLKKALHKGKRFPARPYDPPSGRPVGSS